MKKLLKSLALLSVICFALAIATFTAQLWFGILGYLAIPLYAIAMVALFLIVVIIAIKFIVSL